jgi:hydrocephalus-inducing protein
MHFLEQLFNCSSVIFQLSAHLQMEVERLIVQDYALDHQKTVPSDSTDDSYVGYRNRPKLAK